MSYLSPGRVELVRRLAIDVSKTTTFETARTSLVRLGFRQVIVSQMSVSEICHGARHVRTSVAGDIRRADRVAFGSATNRKIASGISPRTRLASS
jgi:hypothetical protein